MAAFEVAGERQLPDDMDGHPRGLILDGQLSNRASAQQIPKHPGERFHGDRRNQLINAASAERRRSASPGTSQRGGGPYNTCGTDGPGGRGASRSSRVASDPDPSVIERLQQLERANPARQFAQSNFSIASILV
jgi:hypothetical protein